MAVTQRADIAKERLAAALLALVRAGTLAPTAPEVAKRAGVSLRLVFHHFADMEGVWMRAAARQLARLRELAPPLAADGPFAKRLAAFTAQRAALYEELTPVRRAALLKEPFSTAIAASLRDARRWKRAETERVFAAELWAFRPGERGEVAAAVAAAASWSAWHELRAHQRLSIARARRVMARTIAAILQAGES